MWRVSTAEPFGLHLWFDPDCEVPTLRSLTAGEKCSILDSPVSVSALESVRSQIPPLDQLSLLPEGDPHGSELYSWD